MSVFCSKTLIFAVMLEMYLKRSRFQKIPGGWGEEACTQTALEKGASLLVVFATHSKPY